MVYAREAGGIKWPPNPKRSHRHTMHIVDRRLNPSGKNLANRQRFMRRAKSQIRKAVHESAGSRSIKDADEGGEVVLPAQGVHEPSFRRSGTGGLRGRLAGVAAAGRKAARMGMGRTISASPFRAKSSLIYFSRISNFPIWRNAG